MPVTSRWSRTPGAGVLVGATSAGPTGGEVLGFLALAVHAEVPTARLVHMIYAYPTFHRAIEAALADLIGRGRGDRLAAGHRCAPSIAAVAFPVPAGGGGQLCQLLHRTRSNWGRSARR